MIKRIITTITNASSSDHYVTFFDQASSSSSTLNVNSSSFKLWPADNFSFLFESSPVFAVHSKNIRIIHEPTDFYDSILQNAKAAKQRISLASLYLGIGKMESALIDAIDTNLKNNSELKVNILLDYARGTRGQNNSKQMVMPLLEKSDNCNLSLYHTPKLRGLLKRFTPARWNELVGLQHMKIYVFDSKVIISGANLSNDYFTNRQDRYIEITDVPLANFFSSLIEHVQEFSIKVNKSGDESMHEKWKYLPYEGDYNDFMKEARNRMFNFFDRTFNQQQSHLLGEDDNNDIDTWIFPTLEMGQLNIHHDSIVTQRILSAASDDSTFKITTGYFNLTQKFMDTLVNECSANCDIIMAHPNANGFKGSKFPSSGIPDAYTLISRQFHQQIVECEQKNRINLFEYEREKWTYHSKGIWYKKREDESPCMTIVGSSNYGERSVNRDLEAQVCIVTANKTLQESFKKEYEHLERFTSNAESDLVTRPIPNWVRAVVLLCKKFF
jgi:CDP-diacylglycerol--glycerol-3-phosphate 3-phosphatidyltransferase